MKWIIHPDGRQKIAWDIFACCIYLYSLVEDSFFTVTYMYPLLVPAVKQTQTVFSFIMVIDIFIHFFTAYDKELRIEFDE